MIKSFMQKLNNHTTDQHLFDPARLADPIAHLTAWTPIRGGGANFRTHKLIRANMNRLEFRAAIGTKLFCSAFILMGIGMLTIICLSGKRPPLASETLVPTLLSLLFAAAGVGLLYYGCVPIVFDQQRQGFWKGWNMPDAARRSSALVKHAPLQEIHALQIIAEHCRGSKGRSYFSFELNLVLENGERRNVIDHGNLQKLRQDAATLSAFLGKPVWDATQY